MHWQECLQLDWVQKKAICSLWNTEYPMNLGWNGVHDLEAYLAPLQDIHHFLLTQNKTVKGWYADFNRNGERWFLMILSGKIQGKGWGTQMLQLALSKHPQLNGWVVVKEGYKKADGDLYVSPLPFYLKHGFKLLPEQRLETEKLSAVKISWG